MPKPSKPPGGPPELGQPPPTQGKPPKPTEDEHDSYLITHDTYIKRLLANRRRALAFMRHFLPRKISVRLADRRPVLLDAQHVSAKLRTSQSDLIYKIFLEGGGFFYAVVEHKSALAARVLRQSYGYYTSLLSRIHEEVAQALDGDPVIVTLLVYNGLQFWNPEVTLSGETAEGAIIMFALLLAAMMLYELLSNPISPFSLGLAA